MGFSLSQKLPGGAKVLPKGEARREQPVAAAVVSINISSGLGSRAGESCEEKPGKRRGKEGKAKVRSSARAEGVQMAAAE